jgi:hypothetical protein
MDTDREIYGFTTVDFSFLELFSKYDNDYKKTYNIGNIFPVLKQTINGIVEEVCNFYESPLDVLEHPLKHENMKVCLLKILDPIIVSPKNNYDQYYTHRAEIVKYMTFYELEQSIPDGKFIAPSGSEYHYKDHKLHNDNGPAIYKKFKNGYKQVWLQHGVKHRDDDLPAVIDSTYGKSWYKNGLLHRIGKPSFIGVNGRLEFHEEGKWHRDDHKPAYISINESVILPQMIWYIHGKRYTPPYDMIKDYKISDFCYNETEEDSEMQQNIGGKKRQRNAC